MSERVQKMFSGIAGRYDLANDVLSFGIHRIWRKQLLNLVKHHPVAQALDICTGTGDLAFGIARTLNSKTVVIGLDFVGEMLTLAGHKRERALRKDLQRVVFVQGDALSLPFKDNSFDLVTVAFGIRNVDDPLACLREVARVLAPHGVVVVLEFGKPRLPVFSSLYRFYSNVLMPWLGERITGDRAAYEYLPQTARQFPDGSGFVELLHQANYECLTCKALMSGIAYVYVGRQNPASLAKQPIAELASR